MLFSSFLSYFTSSSSHEDFVISRFHLHHRLAKPHSVFIAHRGQKTDGHDFLGEVATRGTKAALVDLHYKGSNFGMQLIRVPDIKQELKRIQLLHIAKYFQHVPIVAVVGSVGKTTTKDFVAHVLSAKYKVTKSEQNQNSFLMRPLCFLNAPLDTEMFVIEIGISQPKDMKFAVEGLVIDSAVITRLGIEHAMFFSSLEDIYREELDILLARPQHVFVHHANRKIPLVEQKLQGQSTSFYGDCQQTDASFLAVAENLDAAEKVAYHYGVLDLPKDLPPLSSHRLHEIWHEGILFIDDSYNASPTSVEIALQDMRRRPFRRKIFVFGSMKELGKYSQGEHLRMSTLAGEICDYVFFYGEETQIGMQYFLQHGKLAAFFTDKKTLQKALYDFVKEGDVVLIKGSNSMQLWDVLPHASALHQFSN